jgi:hypothetical protein
VVKVKKITYQHKDATRPHLVAKSGNLERMFLLFINSSIFAVLFAKAVILEVI